MKKLYVSPAIEVSAFIAEDILCASTISFENGNTYDVVSRGIAVDANGKQVVNGSDEAPAFFGD